MPYFVNVRLEANYILLDIKQKLFLYSFVFNIKIKHLVIFDKINYYNHQ